MELSNPYRVDYDYRIFWIKLIEHQNSLQWLTFHSETLTDIPNFSNGPNFRQNLHVLCSVFFSSAVCLELICWMFWRLNLLVGFELLTENTRPTHPIHLHLHAFAFVCTHTLFAHKQHTHTPANRMYVWFIIRSKA